MKVACTVWVQGKIRENPTYAHMNTENSTDLQNYYLNDLFRIMNKIVDISADGDYIYRGETGMLSGNIFQHYTAIVMQYLSWDQLL